LRVGLLIDSFIQPGWAVRIIRELKNSAIAEIVLVVQNSCSETERKSVLRRLWERRNYLAYAAYTKLDERLSRLEPDAFEKTNVEELLGDVPLIQVTPTMNKFTDRLTDDDLVLIRNYQLDVALRFGFRILKGKVLEIPRYGIWSYHHDDGRVIRGGPPGFWEVMTDDPVTGSMLQVINEDLDNGRVIYRSWSPTINKFSVRKNNNNYYWKSSSFVMRKLAELYEKGSVSGDYDEHLKLSQPYCAPLFKTPTNYQMLGLWLGLLSRGLSRGVEKLFAKETWSLAYRFRVNSADPNNSFHKFSVLHPPSGKFWADPFPVKVDDKYYVFFEEFSQSNNKAHISLIELQRGHKPKAPIKVLERPYHLSYPFVFEWEGTHYMIPETGKNNTVELYRCKSFPYEWEFDRVLLEERNPTDATLVEFEGRWWMFVNIEEPGVTVNWEELHLFHAPSPLGPWTPNRMNPVKSDVRNSRPAGRLITHDKVLYRPAQDCSKRYGYATVINKVTKMNPDEYSEEEISRITPGWHKEIIGTHTLNSVDDLTVIDCLVKRSIFSGSRSEASFPSTVPAARHEGACENVLQFIHSFIDGGSERQMIQLTKLLLESGKYRVHVACLSNEGFLKPEIERLGFDNIPAFPLSSFYDKNAAVQLRRFSAYLKENNIQLIQTHDFYSNIFGMAGAALAGIPVRIASRRETAGMRTANQKRAELLSFRLAKSIVTNAEAVKATLVSEGVAAEKINVIHNGLDLDRLAPAILSRAEILDLLRLPPESTDGANKFVTIVANLRHEVKDHSMFLRAARRIHAAMPETRFLLAGEGQLADSLQEFASELGLNEVTFFLGRCTHVPELLKISDVCVLSSKAEGFSNSILEYMAAAKPVVATNVGGAAEAVREAETGFLVEPGDDEAMAQRIVMLLRDPEARRLMGQRARQIVETNYSCASQLAKTEMLYESLLPRNGIVR
jgi:glycosyltransferase involved in cell wall biosynthesis